MHGPHDSKIRQTIVSHFFRNERRWNNTRDVPSCRESSIRQGPHESDPCTTVNQVQLARGKSTAKLFSNRSIARQTTRARPGEHADAFHVALLIGRRRNLSVRSSSSR